MKYNLPVILLNGTVLMPQDEIKLEFSDELSKNLIDEAEFFHDNKVFVVTKISLEENIIIKDLPLIGTIAKISRKLELPNGKVRIVIKGIERARVLEYLNLGMNIIEAIVSSLEKEEINEDTKNVIIKKILTELDNCIKKVPYVSNSILSLVSELDDLSKITDIVVSHLPLDSKRKLDYLSEISSVKRTEMILGDIYKEEQLFNLENNIDDKVKKCLDKDQKDFYLKEKIKLLKKELGELSTKEEEIESLKEKINNLNASEKVKNKILHELDRYENMSSISPELSNVRNYIDLMINLPWNIETSDIDDIKDIKMSLEGSHYGLDEVKSRIVEYLVVKKHSESIESPILCLVGPPGVGKTTLALSIAKSIGRNFVKVSVGGVDDEAIIKGHIRTYLGSTCGKIIDGINRAKSSNPVFLIDEIDKMSNNYKGDPSSALLEVLDSNQNKYFKDNYLEEEYDLSKVLFITTANDVNSIPLALKDRLEIINIEGYTEYEKIEISKKYLIPTICKSHGIKEIKISDEELLKIIRNYTKESGVRELERKISKIIRKIVVSKLIVDKKTSLTVKNVEKYLGNVIYDDSSILDDIGVVNALACTPYGGDVIQVETNYYEGTGNLIVTGALGDVMIESAKIALSYIKSNYKLFNIDNKIFKNDIHINVPNIALKKEGPSAGVAITTSIISALTNINISNKIAMTGEITLRGNILKVGGLKEKVIGSYINNINTIFIPYSNISDLDSIPSEIKSKIKFIPVKKYDEIFKYIMEDQNV